MVSLGIDIGSYSIKVVEIESTNRGFKLNRFLKIPLSIDPNKDKEIEILDALRNLSQEYDPSNTKYILGIATSQLTVRKLLFPFKERHKILKSIPFELEDEIPLAQEDIIFSAKVIAYLGPQTEVLALACPKKIIENRIQLSEDCNFPLDIISVNNLALANLFTSWSEAPPSNEISENSDIVQPAEILLNLGHQVSNLVVLRKGLVVEIRDFDWGGIDLAKALTNLKSIHITEAIREIEKSDLLIINPDVATQDEIKSSDALKSEIDKLTNQLKLTLLELKSLYNLNFVKGTITGGLSQLVNLNAYLTQKTEIPFKKIDVLSTLQEVTGNISTAEGPIAGTAIGLAIEGLKKPKSPAINLRVDEYKKESQTFKLYLNKWSHTLSLAAATFIFFLVYGMVRESFTLSMSDKAEEALRDHGEQILEIKRTKVSVKKINEYINQQKKIQKDIKMTENLQFINSALDILTLVSQKTPSKKIINLNIKNFQLENEALKLEGEVKDPNTLSILEKSLESIAIGKKVKKSPASIKAQPGWVAFAFDMKIQRREEN
ncbi:MAG: pilus assembly protein PilM [Bdellovibrionaceae bacterium]|nr:pilus assembly protein PilM [Pseudobdellovibrionaceae bacterium]